MQMKKPILYAVFALTLIATHCGFADGSVQAISDLSQNIHSSIFTFARILTIILLITGISCMVSAFYKFHAHYKNPNQAPIVQPICFLLVGAALCLFPYLITGTTKTIYGASSFSKIGSNASGTGPFNSIIDGR